MGMTDEAGNITKDFTLGSLADMMETAYTFYTNDMSEDKWLQNLFDGREIVCDAAVNMASFTGTIGGKTYVIAMIVPELQ